ncbi:hypothetical protein BRC72_08280 [Halobacteriales archaeon QH_7_66_36]|nr:MAG: hypothetical protein BRC72_08280 [Halobacteriales archaeon QH_7_66_36]
MVQWPWRRGSDEAGDDAPDDDEQVDTHADALVTCRFQDGTIAVHEDRVVIERTRRSRFEDTDFQFETVVDVDYDEGITVGYLQLRIEGIDPDSGGLLSDPVNERTVHFGRGNRDCARAARDAILERAGG